MAFEALNHAGSLDLDLLVVLNDNDMSISPPVGAVSNYLARILSSRFYNRVRDGGKSALRRAPGLRELWALGRAHEGHGDARHPVRGARSSTTSAPSTATTCRCSSPPFRHRRPCRAPPVARVTQKGRGYQPAEGQPVAFHGVSPFDARTGELKARSGAPSYTEVFGDWICDAAARDARLVAITPGDVRGVRLVRFAETYPERYFDVASPSSTP